MNQLIQGFRKINKLDKLILSMIIIIFILLCVSIGISLNHIKDYSQNRDSGNSRWKQVEQIILDYKHKVDVLEKTLEDNGIVIIDE